jgi:acyl-[acyl-carrier-protein]-phospholipid O-acyltransferase/long-chain-fatty-acid--[acyl-carrier-protein] ligase
MQQMTFETSSYQQTLTQSLFESARRYGMGMEIIEDFQRRPLTYRTFILRLFILGGWIKNHTAPKEQVGILLPTSSASTVSFFALLLVGRVPTLLNFSLGERVLMNTCDLAQARLVLTSRDFVKRARLETTIHHLKKQTKVFYLEDIKGETGFVERIKGLVFSYFPEWASREDQESITPQDPAAILFTSGSEGFPKGVVLSHENLNANRYQITSMIDLNPQDVLLNVLPTFHAFGLTAGMLTPLLTGIRSFQYPSPLHYRIIPVISYEIDATIFFGTDTFLHKYALCAHPYDFYSMRYVVSGAEHLREETRKLWLDKFGIQLYNAYGATEASPAVALNTRMQNQRGTVGRFVPGIQHVISPLEGMEGSGRLCIKGPNVMMGYIDPETKKIVPPAAPLEEGGDLQPGWYDTGDIVSIDSQGFVTIQDRSKRFAKVAGEMISLTAVEHRLYEAFPGYQHLVLAVPDPRKGEQLVVLTTADLTREQVLQAFREKGYGELMMPRTLFRVDAIPLLPTGKTDFGKAKLMLQELMGFLD